MGGNEAKLVTPEPEPLLTDKPWRQIKGWDRSVREELKENVASLAPVTNGTNEVPFFNILLTGPSAAGRSSYFNSIDSLFLNRISIKADTGASASILTKEFRIYEIKSHPNRAPLPWRIIDNRGIIYGTSETDVRNTLKAVDGHVPDRYEFVGGVDFYHGCPGFVANPTLAELTHCVAIVIDAERLNRMEEDMQKQLRSLREGLSSRNIPTFIILTHIDEACKEVHKDLKNVYRSITIRDLVSKVGKFMDVPENKIFPVKNYSREMDVEDDIDILLLYSLREMLHSAQEYIESMM